MKTLLFLLGFALILVLGSCKKNNSTGSVTDPTLKTTKDLVIPDAFNFKNSNEVSVGILITNGTSVLSNVPVEIYLDYPGASEAPNMNARFVGTYTSSSDGRIDTKIAIPTSDDSLYLRTNYIGIESESGFAINGTTASYTYGTGNNLKLAQFTKSVSLQPKAAVTYGYIGKYTSDGRPLYLIIPNDIIPQSLLDDVNASLPERVRLTVSHPTYLKDTNEGDVVLKEQADVWITFVSEGAGYRNSIGYYTYDAAAPPTSASQIKAHNIIFPNASLSGSGGSLPSGAKVLLGRFPAGTGIGWFIVADGWTGSFVTGQTIYYSEPAFNPETDATKRQHTVLLNDNTRSQFLLAFEDLNRVTGGSDDDFNDAIFYITSNPVTAINNSNVPAIDSPKDSDKDGVTDVMDEFPNDPLRAYTSYYPGKDQFNSLLIEDLWPSFGDFDFNDMVVDCQYKQVTNSKTGIVELYMKLKVRAIGASYKNGFGIQFPIASSSISLVTLTDQKGVIKNIGAEAGQNNAVVIAFDDAFALLSSTGGLGVNVIPGNGWTEPKEIELHILFTVPQTIANLGTAPYNPFAFLNNNRKKEIHLANAKPTSLADITFFGQSDDTSNPTTSRYYKSKNNMVWMLEVPSSFAYTVEKKDILKAYLKFGAWAESGGSLFKDWYIDKPGYRDNALIYSK